MAAQRSVEHYIIVRSVTYAQTVLRILRANGLRAWIGKSPVQLSDAGCGHAVRVPGGNARDLRRILETAGLPRFRIYSAADGTDFREEDGV